MVEVSHQSRQHGGIAHSGIENSQGGRHRIQALDVQRYAVGYDLLFAAGTHKEQVLFAVVVKPERAVVAIGQIDLLCGAEIACYFRDRARP